MRVFVATKEMQGQRKSDFSWATEGELVYLGMECDSDNDRIDGRCGCRRSFTGMETHKATTTAKVVETELTAEQFREQLMQSLEKAGWLESEEKANPPLWVTGQADYLVQAASQFPLGEVVEKRGSRLQTRLTEVKRA